MSVLKRAYWTIRSWSVNRSVQRVCKAFAQREDGVARVRRPREPLEHVQAAADWLMRAHDAGGDGGVSAEYRIGSFDWLPSYPETTGYIIPTLLALSKIDDRHDYEARARRMGDWLTAVQLDCGGISYGTVDSEPKMPTVFNTGQVMHGWSALLKRGRNLIYEKRLEQAGHWLCTIQDDDGCWRTGGSPFVSSGAVNTYNVRTAWALVDAGLLLGNARFVDCGRRNVEWASRRETSPGFLEHNDFADNTAPWLHTIAYAGRGFFETGLLLDDDGYVALADRIASGVGDAVRTDGSIPGRLDRQFRGQCAASCLTGNAQILVLWRKLDAYYNSRRYARCAEKVSCFLKCVQSLDHEDAGVRGAIGGSYPLGGSYSPYSYPNWAAKFFVDALIGECPAVPESADQEQSPAELCAI